MQTEDIEQKKHVYLYLIKTLSRFVHSQYIRVEKTIDYLAGPIQWYIHTSATSQSSTSSSDPAVFTVTPKIPNKLLIALNECSEWG
ncbi:hypothetical protein DFH94DRAFT_703556 [Russula ochroleuca]|uniref:Uncharacterized protein n=1 Tax=Russula ochroleuca TaxID=152965 RepID=A0A9P5N658_9AGAM|nr:hypothetical protein DFH94DRAFT_703556 [Russula ochroleuca]